MARLRGLTLVELVVYAVLSLLVLGLLLTLLLDGRRLFGQTTATFLVDRAFDRALATLKNDLAETSLSSVRVYPGPAGGPGAQEPPGLSLVSAGGRVTPEGVPHWQKHVYYTLEPGSDRLTGTLLRWERPLDKPGGVPWASELLPSRSRGDRPELVLRGVQLPDTALPEVAGSEVGSRGGFQVTFVRRESGRDSLIATNPAQVCAGGGADVQAITSLLDVELRVWRPADSVSASQFAIVRFRVCPRTVP